MVGAGSLVAIGACVVRYGLDSTPQALLEGSTPLALIGFPLIVAFQLAWQLGPGLSHGPSHEMLQSLLLLSALATFYLIVRLTVNDENAVRRMFFFLFAVGGLQAGYAVLNLLAGNERLLIYERWAYLNSATGTLVSRNHFAFLMEMLLPFGIACTALTGASTVGRSARRLSREKAPISSEVSAQRGMMIAVVVMMGLALVFSRSRMGIASLGLAWLTVTAADRLLRPDNRRRTAERKRRAAPLLAIALVAAYAAVIGLEPVIERFLHLPQDLENGRMPIWTATANMIADAPILGHGWGTFEALLPGYRSEPTGFYYDHAHNEYLEVFAESGIIGLGLLAWLLFLFGRRAVHALSARWEPADRAAVFWSTVAIVSVLIHSAADFGLRTPGVAFTFMVVLAVYSRLTEKWATTHQPGTSRPPRAITSASV